MPLVSGWETGSQYPLPPPVQRMACPTNTSVRTVFLEDIINYVLNYVPGFRIKVSGQRIGEMRVCSE